MYPVITLLAGGTAAYLVYIYVRATRARSDLPPCLPSLPILGSLPFLSGLSTLHLCLTDKALKYGNIFGMYVGNQYTLVLSGYELIREALVNNSNEYADRGEMYFEKHIWQDFGKGVSLRRVDEDQRRIRNNCMAVLRKLGYGNSSVMESRIAEEIDHLLEHIADLRGSAWCPESILQHCGMNVIYNLMFGCRFDYNDSVGEFLQSANHAIADAADAVYDVLPIITYLPNIKRKIDGYRQTYKELLDFYKKRIEEAASNITSETNFIQEYIKTPGFKEGDEEELHCIVRDLVIGGTETSSGQINWAMILLANHQAIQSRLQKEMDVVVARDRLPNLDDRLKLPYLEATILEVMRIRTAVPLGLLHKTTADTRISGYHVPARAQVMTNFWSAHMDKNVWGDPETFRPDRFLDEEGNVINRDLIVSFSLGKRACLGELLARQELFLIFSALVHRFTFLPPEGETKVKDDIVFSRTAATVPHLLRCVPRD